MGRKRDGISRVDRFTQRWGCLILILFILACVVFSLHVLEGPASALRCAMWISGVIAFPIGLYWGLYAVLIGVGVRPDLAKDGMGDALPWMVIIYCVALVLFFMAGFEYAPS